VLVTTKPSAHNFDHLHSTVGRERRSTKGCLGSLSQRTCQGSCYGDRVKASTCHTTPMGTPLEQPFRLDCHKERWPLRRKGHGGVDSSPSSSESLHSLCFRKGCADTPVHRPVLGQCSSPWERERIFLFLPGSKGLRPGQAVLTHTNPVLEKLRVPVVLNLVAWSPREHGSSHLML
jgi:hypothetical protein